jgi:hypothetical protein
VHTTSRLTTEHKLQPKQPGQSRGRALWVLGPLPPPITGMTLLTSAVLKALQSAGPVQHYNWSPGMPRRSLWMRLRRNARMLHSIARLIARGRVRNQRLYVVANSYSGLYLTMLLVFVAARLGYTICLHHHVYSYIDDYDSRMAWIARQMGPRDAHVVHAELLLIHPFREGNGRLARWLADLMALQPELFTGLRQKDIEALEARNECGLRDRN